MRGQFKTPMCYGNTKVLPKASIFSVYYEQAAKSLSN